MFERLQRPVRDGDQDLLEHMYGVYRFHVGDHEIIVIYDGAIGVKLKFLAVNAPEDEVRAVLGQHGLGDGFIRLPIGNVLVRIGDRKVLLDTGTGSSELVRKVLGDYVGGLVPTLKQIGVSPEDVTDVIFSHSHLDHVGATSVDGELVFPNAQHYLPALEWEFLKHGEVPDHVAPLVDFAKRQLAPLDVDGGQLSLYGDGDELAPGIRAVSMPGHSAGHHGLEIASRGERLLLPFDVLGHFVVSLEHPEWLMAPDAEQPSIAIDTRRRFLARAADEQLAVLAHHFPFPGLGRVVRQGDVFRWVPTS